MTVTSSPGAARTEPMADIRTLQRSEIDSATAALAEAFLHDSMYRYFFGQTNGDIDPKQLRALLDGLVSLGLAAADVYCGKDAAHGAAIVMPPGLIEFPTKRMASTIIARLSHTGFGYLRRVLPISAELNRKRPKEPHWYVLLIGVAPALQGRGLGRRMMQHILQRADAVAQPVYLETSTRSNLRFYEQLGFHVQEEFRCHAGKGPLTWSMLHTTVPARRGVTHDDSAGH